ncbi:hypothetical protein QEN58_09610 [Halomonas alkaliantarctica]|uniref:Guanylate cyclase domain-containing protein n=1 Tax=Halomonas alkaliantarctica TaxID=232346 RepID=A0ABY8LSB0_9GAMM|nr:hypothetical protein [Halomonas alkaliantarctica]WGI27301.1 hypothetical protein QEN58_09610 [Halomonas alkaliantarctica]
MDRRWGISVDIEGFSALYESGEAGKDRVIWALHELMDAIIKIGQLAYPGDVALNESDRIFAHQFGDGFVIVSNFEETDSSRCIAIATSIMRHMAICGFCTKSAISVGDMADIKGCYPDSFRFSHNGTLPLGAGLMTTIPVMGTALTKAYKLSSRVSGSVLVVDKLAFEHIPDFLVVSCTNDYCFIDWRSNEHKLAKTISAKSGLEFGDRDQLLDLFEKYIETEPRPPEKWVMGSRSSIGKNT